MRQNPSGDSVPRFIGYAHFALRKYGRFSDRAPARESGSPDFLFIYIHKKQINI